MRYYEKPEMYAEQFVPNQYVAACQEPMYSVTPTQVRCTSKGHNNTQFIMMFLDSQPACVAKFVPKVGSASGDIFKTKYEACRNVVGCNKLNWLQQHPNDTNFRLHGKDPRRGGHGSGSGDDDGDGFMYHDTEINLKLAEKYNLS